jgi:Fur family peroxide stress response transcriptional regulator
MQLAEKSPRRGPLNERLATSGLRFTRQRQHVYDVLLEQRDHPTAEEVFLRAKHGMPDISLATVYNCLDALVRCGLVRPVHLSRGASHFCPNMAEHSHFCCDVCGAIFDVDLPATAATFEMPRGFKASHVELAIHGACPNCGPARQRPNGK